MNSINQQSNYFKCQVLRPAMIDMLSELDFKWHLTANFNRTTTTVNGRDKLKAWSSFLDRKLHGRNYYKKPKEQRLFFAAIPETGVSSTHLHYHLLATLPEICHEEFPLVAEATWKQFAPVGSLYVQRIGDTKADLQRVIAYDLKEVWKQENFANLIFSTEFSSYQQGADQ